MRLGVCLALGKPLGIGVKKPHLKAERGSNLEPRASEEDALCTPPPDLGSNDMTVRLVFLGSGHVGEGNVVSHQEVQQ